MTVQKPKSICASVPKNTSSSDRTNKATVSRSEASALRPCMTCHETGRVFLSGGKGEPGAWLTPEASVLVTAVTGGAAAGGLGAVSIVLLIGGSGELHGFHERLEFALVGGDDVLVSQ